MNYAEDMASLVYMAFRPIFSRRDSQGSVSNLQAETLNLLSVNEPKMSDISENLRISPPAATALVRNLVRVGNVERKSDDEDHRLVRLKLTARGKQILEKIRKDRTSRWEKVSGQLDSTDRTALLRILRKITAGN